MKQAITTIFILATFFSCLPLCLADGSAAAPAPVQRDLCAILTVAEISEIIGKPVGEGKLDPNASPVMGQPCHYTVAEYGAFSLWIGSGQANPCDKTREELVNRNIKTTDAPGIGDCAFFADMGYGMLQLNAWKGPDYLIVTLMVPGASEDQQRGMADKLMKLVLTKL